MSGSSLTAGAPNPTPADHASPFLEFSSFFLNGYDPLVSEFISQQQQRHQQAFAFKDDSVVESPEINPEDSREGPSIDNKKRNKVNAVKKPRRTGKKDRHSKIYTAQGPRDRRMRLSLQIARKFFDLQDMLGFDKASKTIDWLFMKSKSAIKELTDNLPRVKRSNRLTDNCVSSTSESEVVSGMKLTEHIEDKRSVSVVDTNSHLSNLIKQKSKKPHKTALNPLARESRDKARARARERTRERMKVKALEKAKPFSQANPNNLKQREPKSPKANDQSLSIGSQKLNSFKDVVGEEVPITDLLQHQMDSVSISNKITGVISEPRSSLIFDFSHSIAATGAPNIEEITGFPVNWDVNIGRMYHGQCTMRNRNMSTGNVYLLNPNSILTGSSRLVPPNTQEQTLTSIFMSSQDQYCDSDSLANTIEQNRNSILIPSSSNTRGLHSNFIHNQWSRGPFFIKYGR